MSNLRTDILGRYYTKEHIGAILVSQMTNVRPSQLLDLGAGSGSLSHAAVQRWRDVDVLTVDIDAQPAAKLQNLLRRSGSGRHWHIQADVLSERLPELVSRRSSSIDAAVCNPPFITPRWRRGFAEILEDAGLSGALPAVADADAALLFLAQNLRLMAPKATLGIVLPDTLISAAKYRAFRRDLVNRYCVSKVIRLPRRSFQNTDAQAHILIISKGRSPTNQIELRGLSQDYALGDQIFVDPDQATLRLDFEYHFSRQGSIHRAATGITLASLGSHVQRGSFSGTDRFSSGFPVLHTTDIQPQARGSWCHISGSTERHKLDMLWVAANKACPGDILVARVGRNLEQKVIGVYEGIVAISDCVYRVEVPKRYRDQVLAQIASARGAEWLASRAYGVSAKQLTKSDLLNFPLSL
ncbi:MAG: N-6 DNA methylase [Rhodocyclaceae bacterium]|nr:N-6 DNA methylase [Rhodocyclaceae bacterium]MCA3029598.1 N-6 DNA methylase [Rhodocyclaceae bacterium]MCA3060566.1 N-6 DNA methylase [Rhodocyclaceae bacterium]MCA3083664.1 N-6 DNA methylase [Rhodocyclaceae bacterium]